MSNKCKVLILGKEKAFADDEKKRNEQKQQIQNCRKQKFETFKEKFNKGLKDVKGVVTGEKKIGILDNKKQ